MSSTLPLKPSEATQKAIEKIRMDASKPASYLTDSSFKPKERKVNDSQKGKKKSYHDKKKNLNRV